MKLLFCFFILLTNASFADTINGPTAQKLFGNLWAVKSKQVTKNAIQAIDEKGHRYDIYQVRTKGNIITCSKIDLPNKGYDCALAPNVLVSSDGSQLFFSPRCSTGSLGPQTVYRCRRNGSTLTFHYTTCRNNQSRNGHLTVCNISGLF